jgi:hypothetical protein
MPRVSQAEMEELVASKLWGVCYPAELQRPAPLGQPFELILHDQLATQATVWLPPIAVKTGLVLLIDGGLSTGFLCG